MNRLQEFLDNPHIITGTATVAADPQLTLIAANKAFYTLVGETAESFRQQGNALLPWIEQSSAVRLIGLLAGHPPLFDWEGTLVRKDDTSVRIRLSGTRMEGVLHEGRYPVYLSAFTDLACVEEMLRSAEYERRKYALIADISEDLPFEYDFETDTIAYTQKYHKVFGHEPIIPRFRERLGRGEAIDPVSEGFREPFLALDAEKASSEATPERFLPTLSGRKRWFALYSANILDTLGKPVKSVGALRDIDFGIYPYTTSSNPIAAYAPVGSGLPTAKLDEVVGVVKAYSSCVGEGPFVCEWFGDEAQKLRDAGAEYGAKTGRPRRVGPIDLVATRYGVEVQGATNIALTKLDILSYMDKIPVCAHYELDGQQTDEFPFPVCLQDAKPVIEYVDGWKCDISGVRKWENLPEAARNYVEYVEREIGCHITYVSVGPERDSIIIR
mgnify:CR=1 FL=1